MGGAAWRRRGLGGAVPRHRGVEGDRDSASLTSLTSASTSPLPLPPPTASMQAAGGLCVFLNNNNNHKWGLKSSCAHALGVSCSCIASVCPQTISRAAVLGEDWGWGWVLGYKVDETCCCPRAAHIRHEMCKSPTARRCRDGHGNGRLEPLMAAGARPSESWGLCPRAIGI